MVLDFSEENLMASVQAAKLKKVKKIIRDERGFLFQFPKRTVTRRFAPPDSSARQRPS
jgi:hypothetical protein